MDSIGNITVPEIVPSGTFPIVSDYGYGLASAPQIVEHQFGSANAKITQRFLLGTGARRFTVRKAAMNDVDREALRDFWELNYGPYGAFTYNAPNDDGAGTTAFTCRFADEPLSWEFLSDAISSTGVTLIEIPDPDDAPAYTLNSTVTRFPSSGLKTALLSQVQEIIPLVKIQPREVDYPAIYVSDRRCTVGAQLYLARLLEFDGIQQSIGNESDQAQFTFGNADRVMRELANDTDLSRATLEFSLFHVGTGIKLDLWKGEISDWNLDAGPEFPVTAVDGIYELSLAYPPRKISRTCWKCFDDGNGCPYTAHGSGGDPTSCDKGYDTANGCKSHGMKLYFGGILAEPQGVTVKDNSTGTLGFGRSSITSVSIVADSIYDQVVPEVYTKWETNKDKNGLSRVGRLVNCKVASGRAEIDFYDALGIVGEGPLTLATAGHTLDNQYNHGYPGLSGLHIVNGNDPAGVNDMFSLSQSSGGSWVWKDNYAAGLAFVELRRKDTGSLQLSYPSDHAMQAVVLYGLQGWVWTAAGTRTEQVLTNPIWIAVNMMLRARGLRFSSAATAEQYFDVDAAIAAAAICDTRVAVLVGLSSGTCDIWTDVETDEIRFTIDGSDDYPVGRALTIEGNDYYVTSAPGGYGILSSSPGDGSYSFTVQETQFQFMGVLQEQKPLRDWIQEVLMNCLGYYSFSFGKLKLGIRENSSVIEAFTEGNILFGSLKVGPLSPTFNHLTANFADGEFNFAANSVQLYDVDHAKFIGGTTAPLFLKSNMNLSGTSTKSQAARIISTRMREELGGINATHWKRARRLTFQTTVLALNTDPGMVCSMTHEDMPADYGEFRVGGWKLKKDYSIDIQGQTTVDEMYDLTVGPKPADITADPIPIEILHPLRSVDHLELTELSVQDDTNPDIYHRKIRCDFAKPLTTYETSFTRPVYLPLLAVHTTGGTIAGAQTLYVEVAPDKNGLEGLPSEFLAIVIPAGTNTNSFDLTIQLPAEATHYVIRAGTIPGRLSKLSRTESPGTDPFAVTITTIASLDDSSLSACQYFHHVHFSYRYGTGELRDGGQTASPTDATFVFEPEVPQSADTTITVIARAASADELQLFSADDAPSSVLSLTSDTGNPSGESSLVVLQNGDDAKVPVGQAVFQFNGPTANYHSVTDVEVVLSTALPAEGPSAAERAEHPYGDCTIEPAVGVGTCTVRAGDPNITVTRASNADVLERVLLIFTNDASPDSDLEGHVIKTQGLDAMSVDVPFSKGGTYSYVVVKRWFDLGTAGESGNSAYFPFRMTQLGSPEQTVWRTPAIQVPVGTFYATLRTHNRFGVGTTITSAQFIVSAYSVPTDAAAPGAVENLDVGTAGGAFSMRWANPATNINTLRNFAIKYSTSADFTTGVVGPFLGGLINVFGWFDPEKIYYFAVAANNASGDATTNDDEDLAALIVDGWGPWTYWDGVTGSTDIGDAVSVESGSVTGLPSDPDVPNAPYLAVITEKLTNGTFAILFGANRPTENYITAYKTQVQIARDSGFTDIVSDQTGGVPFTNRYYTTQVATFYVRARTTNDMGASAWCSTVLANTTGVVQSADTDVPGVPQNVDVLADDVDPSIPGKELVVSWDRPLTNFASIFAYAIQINDSNVFPAHLVWFFSSSGEATFGDDAVYDANGKFTADMEGKTLWVHSAFPMTEANLKATAVVKTVTDGTHLVLDKGLTKGGTGLIYQIITPDWENVVRSVTVPTKLLDPSVQDDTHFRQVLSNLPHGQNPDDPAKTKKYWVRIKAANEFGIGPWCLIAPPTGAVLDGYTQDDMNQDVSDRMDAASEYFTVIAGAFTDNTPIAGYISWSGVSVYYKGQTYIIADGNTANKYLVWKLSSPTTFTGYAASQTLLADEHYVVTNYLGTHHPVYNATDVDGGTLRVHTVEADRMNVTVLSAIASYLGTIEIATSGYLRCGQTAYNSGTGFWLGLDGATAKFSIGHDDGNRLTWDGSTLTVVSVGGFSLKSATTGARVELTTGGLVGYNSDGVAVVALDASTGYLGFATAASGSRLIVSSDGLRTYSGAICTVWLSSTGAFTIQTADAGARVVLDSNGLTGYDASGGTIYFSTSGNIRSGQTAYDTGTGFWLGLVAGTPKLSIGNSAGNKVTWDNSTLTIVGTLATGSTIANTIVLTSSNLNIADRGWLQTCAFSTPSQTQVNWGAGSFIAADGTTYSISASGTGAMAGKTFVYLNIAVSTTAYQVSATATDAIGVGKVLVAICIPGSVSGEAQFLLLDQGGANIDATNIVAGSITANELAASSVTAGKIQTGALDAYVITLSTTGCIKSGQTAYDTGTGYWLGLVDATPKFSIGNASGNKLTWDGSTLTITATGGFTLKSAASGARLELDPTNGIRGYNATDLLTQLSAAGTFMLKSAATGARFEIDPTNGIRGIDASGNVLTQLTAAGLLSLKSSATGARFELDPTNGFRGYDGSGNLLVQLTAAGVFTLKSAASGARIELDATNGLTGYSSGGGSIIFSTAGNIRAGQTAYDTGTGFWLGQDSTTPKFSIGNAAGNKVTWDGSTLTVVGTLAAGSTIASTIALTSGNLNLADRGWLQTCAFASSSQTVIGWGAGSFIAADGTTYSISAGNTGAMAGRTFVYLDVAVSTTVYQVTATASSAIGAGKVLVAVCSPGSVSGEAQYLLLDQGSVNIDATNIVAGSIVSNNIAAGAIDATKISVETLSAISANMGTITAGTITGATIQSAASGARTYMNSSGFYGTNSGGVVIFTVANGIVSGSSGRFEAIRSTAASLGLSAVTSVYLQLGDPEGSIVTVVTISSAGLTMASGYNIVMATGATVDGADISACLNSSNAFIGSGGVDTGGNVNVASGKVYKVNGTQVLGAQQNALPDVDDPGDFGTLLEWANALNTSYNLWLNRARAHGFIAT